MGLIIIVLFYKSAKENNDSSFCWMWLTIVLRFAFYIPVVLLADVDVYKRQEIVRVHDGSICVKSGKTGGTIFEVTFAQC